MLENVGEINYTTSIKHKRITDECLVAEMLGIALEKHVKIEGKDVDVCNGVVLHESGPVQDFINTILLKEFIKYSIEEFKHEPIDYEIKAFYRVSDKDSYMDPHQHSGSSLTSIVYLYSDGSGNLLVHDPRSQAQRGYIKDILNKEFGTKVIVPFTSDIYIMPSYLLHTVRPSSETLRALLVVDFIILK